MSSGNEEFWSTLPEKVLHPVRVPLVEALRWIGEPLSAIELVDVLDGYLTMWEAAHHLRVLEMSRTGFHGDRFCWFPI